MFWKRLIELCNAAGKSPNGVCAELGFSNAAATKWKKGAVPRSTTLQRIADYFGVTEEYFFTEPAAPAVSAVRSAPTANGDGTVLTPSERLVMYAYRAQPEVHIALHRLLRMERPEWNDYVRLYSAAHSADGHPDEIVYMRRDRWNALRSLSETPPAWIRSNEKEKEPNT